jgi:hypothetical protein
MYTVEMDFDSAVITVLDEKARHEDIKVIIEDSGVVFLVQYDENLNKNHVITISFQQYVDMVAALQSPEGIFKLEVKRGK